MIEDVAFSTLRRSKRSSKRSVVALITIYKSFHLTFEPFNVRMSYLGIKYTVILLYNSIDVLV